MTDATDLPLDPQDRLDEPPLVDHLNREPSHFAIELVPEDWVSPEEKCFVQVEMKTSEGNRIGSLLGRIEELCGVGPVLRIVHGGGGNYRLNTAESGGCALQDLDREAASEVADRIHQIAEAAQIAYRIQESRRSKSA